MQVPTINLDLQLVSTTFKYYFKKSTRKIMKNAFYLIEKAFLVLFCLYFPLPHFFPMSTIVEFTGEAD